LQQAKATGAPKEQVPPAYTPSVNRQPFRASTFAPSQGRKPQHSNGSRQPCALLVNNSGCGAWLRNNKSLDPMETKTTLQFKKLFTLFTTFIRLKPHPLSTSMAA
jgi:hypothetical protein